MTSITAISHDHLTDSPSSPGIVRQMAFKNQDTLVLRASTRPGITSGWHHHGDYDVYGYIVHGAVEFEKKTSEKDFQTVSLGAGDFFHVPPQAVHRERNPSATEENVVILFLRGSGPMVTNLES